MVDISCEPPCAPNTAQPLPPGFTFATGECCPYTLGIVCWSDGEAEGRAFAVRLPNGTIEYVDTTGAGIIPSEQIVACPDDTSVTTRNATLGVVTSTGAGATAAGLAGVSITNIGSANGTVLGQTIAPGQTMTWNAYYDNLAREFVRLPAIAYNGTGTTLSIQTQD